ncbi:MAG: DUF2341 domain-containing protein [Thermoplasmatota archaeon]
MLKRALVLKILILIIILFIPLFLSAVSISQPIPKRDAGFLNPSYQSSLVVGDFQYFNVVLTEEIQQINIIAYHGDSIPDPKHRTESNYYRWEYKDGEWKDISGYSTKYLKPDKCFEKNSTYSFYIGLDNKAKPGQWNIEIFINNKSEVKSSCNIIVIAPFQVFLSSLMGVSQPFNKEEKSIVDKFFICSDRKKIMIESKTNDIDILVDDVLKRRTDVKKEKESKEILDFTIFNEKQSDENEIIRTTHYSYQKSKLKIFEKNSQSSLFFNDIWGKFFLSQIKTFNCNRIVTILLIFLLISTSTVPIIAPDDTSSSLIINYFRISPEIIYLNESIFVEASVSDLIGIQSVSAEINNDTIVSMQFIKGNKENNIIYSGLWQGNWQACNVSVGNYVVTFTATNVNNESSSQQKFFTILTKTEKNNSKNNNVQQNNSTQNTNNSKNNTLHPIQSKGTTINESIVSIVDKRHEEVSILPGSSFYVERTINGLNGTNIVFVPMFSDSLTLESIVIIDNSSENEEIDTRIKKIDKTNVFDSGFGNKPIEQKIEQIKDELPSEIKKLNKVAYVDNIELHNPRTVRLCFRAPTWEQLQNGMDSSGKISYLVFSDDKNDSFDFEGSTWWNANWGYRKLITVNSSLVDGDLVNFPILVSIIDGNLADKAQENGNDIAFVLYSDNITTLNHEIELFNSTSGELVCWVNVSSLSSTLDTKIWMYFGNSDASNQENIHDVWDDNYVGVWHLNETSGNAIDSTVNNNDGTLVNTPIQGMDGKIGKAYSFDGADGDYIELGNNNMPRTDGAVTLEAWAYYPLGTTPGTENLVLINDGSGAAIQLGFRNTAVTTWLWGGSIIVDSSLPGSGEWHHYAFTTDGTNHYLYVNGDQTDTSTVSLQSAATTEARINTEDWGETFDGSIDEVRVSNIARNSNWIKTSYNNINSLDDFLIFGSEEDSRDTSVDNIYPYNITYSPFTITATGSDDVNNVTLWYRHSIYNFTSGITWEDDDGVIWRIQELTTGNGEWTVPSGVTEIDILVVGGGGGAGRGGTSTNNNAGGGGAGGLIFIENYSVVPDTDISYILGSGGAASTATGSQASSGGDTVFGDLNAVGGGGGGSSGSRNGVNGGSGGGAGTWSIFGFWLYGSGGSNTQPTTNDGYENTGFGYAGQTTNINNQQGGGGGGAGSLASGTSGGNGMNLSDFFGTDYGNYGWFAHGGDANSDGSSGASSSGDGGSTHATNNDNIAGDGGSGIILIRYKETPFIKWENENNPDTNSPWSWNFNFPNSTGYYEFFSIGAKDGIYEDMKDTAEAMCYYEYSTDLNTSVNTILPYNQTSSPLTITATSNGYDTPDNVTLYYRWSENNFTDIRLPFTDNLVLHLDANAITGLNDNDSIDIWDDLSGNEYPAEQADPDRQPIYKTDALGGKPAVRFDSNNNEYLQTVWQPSENDGFNNGGALIAVSNPSGSGYRTILGSWGAPRLYLMNYDGSTQTGYGDDWVRGGDFPNEPSIFLANYDGSTLYAYLNQEQVHSYSCSFSGTNSNALTIGQVSGEGRYWNGDIAEIIVYNSSLSPEEQEQIEHYLNVKWGLIEHNNWIPWDNTSNPDTSLPWSWEFNFPNGTGYYEFFSIGAKDGIYEDMKDTAEAMCYYQPSIHTPVINSYDLRNSTGSKLNNNTGLLDVNNEYYFLINITDLDGWADIQYINITAWYDHGSETSYYNETLGGNINMFLQYENTTGIANYNLLWPKDEVQLITTNCSETIIDKNTRIIKMSFKPKNQIRWANSNGSWDSTRGVVNNSYSWNFNISVKDVLDEEDWIKDEYGVYKYTSISPAQDWIDVNVLPGFSDTTNIVAITYSSNYDFNITIYFEENLKNTMHGTTIPIANNVVILAETDPDDDITSDITFLGIGEVNAVDIINDSGLFSLDGVSQTVYVQFMVFVPFGTLGGRYTARVATKIIQK